MSAKPWVLRGTCSAWQAAWGGDDFTWRELETGAKHLIWPKASRGSSVGPGCGGGGGGGGAPLVLQENVEAAAR